MNHRYFFVIPPMVHLLDITGPAHIFYELKAIGHDIELYFLNIGVNTPCTSSAGLAFTQLKDFQDFSLGPKDTIFLPGLERKLLFDHSFHHQCQPFYQWLRQQQACGSTVCSVCTGVFLLAEAKVLRNRSCTTHWKYLAEFRKNYPDVQLVDNRLFVRDAEIWTSAGVTSGIDLALHLIAERYGPLAATQVAKETVVYLRRGAEDPQLSIFLQYRNHLNHQIHTAQDYLGQHLSGDSSLAAVAAAVNMSPRNLSRRFKRHTGLTIGAYLRQLRIEKARALLHQGKSRAEVSAAIGLKSTNQLRSLLGKKMS